MEIRVGPLQRWPEMSPEMRYSPTTAGEIRIGGCAHKLGHTPYPLQRLCQVPKLPRTFDQATINLNNNFETWVRDKYGYWAGTFTIGVDPSKQEL